LAVGAGRRRLDERFVADPARTLALGLALVAAFALLAALVPAHALAFERSFAEWMLDSRAAAPRHVALVLDALGREPWRVLTVVAIALVLLVARRLLALRAFALSEALTPLLASLARGLVDRPRPPGGLVHAAGASFPSGHTAYAAATCVALVLLFSAPGPRRLLWWALAALVVAAMAWSRMYLGVHWLLDVVGGALLGAGVALAVFAAVQRGAARKSLVLHPSFE
jgi:undecaprenyl-diphosphatase